MRVMKVAFKSRENLPRCSGFFYCQPDIFLDHVPAVMEEVRGESHQGLVLYLGACPLLLKSTSD
jgi:hypothetical protein